MGDYSRGRCVCGCQSKMAYARSLGQFLCVDCMAREYEIALDRIKRWIDNPIMEVDK